MRSERATRGPQYVRAIIGLGLCLFVTKLAAAPAFHAHSFVGGIMGTEVKIEVYAQEPVRSSNAVDAAVEELRRIDRLMTTWKPSPLTALNAKAGAGPTEVPLEIAQIISRAIELHALTDGAFDISFYAVGRLWNFKAKPPRIPSDKAIRVAQKLVGADRIKVDENALTVDLPLGMSIGLGGIAKGYAVDRAMKVLREHGIEHGTVNAGGDLKVLGRKNGTDLWEIALKHPRDRERAMGLIRVSNTCVVTSGDYERFFMHEGKRYHHILDPRTGYPATGCMSASVVAFNAELADALATACCVLGPEKGLALIKQLPKVEAVLVGMDGEVHVSPGLQNQLVVPVENESAEHPPQ